MLGTKKRMYAVARREVTLRMLTSLAWSSGDIIRAGRYDVAAIAGMARKMRS